MKPILKYDGDRAESAACLLTDLDEFDGESADAQRMIEEAMACEVQRVLKRITRHTENEGVYGWRVVFDYDNIHDGARILDGDGHSMAECYEKGEPDDQFVRAIDSLIRGPLNNEVRRDPSKA